MKIAIGYAFSFTVAILTLSWALFGGRQVDIETVGDWGTYYGT